MTTFLEAMTAHRYAEKVCRKHLRRWTERELDAAIDNGRISRRLGEEFFNWCIAVQIDADEIKISTPDQRAAALDAAEKLEAVARRLPIVVDSICAGMVTGADTEVRSWCCTEAAAWRALVKLHDARTPRSTP